MAKPKKKDKEKQEEKKSYDDSKIKRGKKTFRRTETNMWTSMMSKDDDDIKGRMDEETRKRYTIIGVAAAIAGLLAIFALADLMITADMMDEPFFEMEAGNLALVNSKIRITVSEEPMLDEDTGEQLEDSKGNLRFDRTEIVIGWLQWLMLAYLAFTGPFSVVVLIRNRRINKMEDRLGEFLRDIAESARSGQTLHQSIRTAAGGSYGALTPEIEKMAKQISWGVNATVAMERFADRVNTPLVRRAATLIIEASNAGGEVAKVLDAAAIDTKEIQLLKKERSLEMSTYVLVIFVAFLVFLVVIFIVYGSFVPQMQAMAESFKQSDTSVSMSGLDPTNVDFGQIQLVYALAGLIQAIGDGLAGGLMSTGKITEGFKFTFFMVLIVFLGFTFVMPFLA